MAGYPSLRRGAASRRFDEYYRCYPVAMLPGPDRSHVTYGGKVILPPSALDKLTHLHISYPMMFELINGAASTMTHAGVIEFTAEEGKIYIPYWLMQVLALEPGDILQVKSADLPSGRFIKLQAQSVNFLDISDPKAVLENVFRNYSCLTVGDVFTFEYNDQTFEMAVLEVKPDTDSHAIVVLETDLEVDFATPVGYEEPKRQPKTSGTGTPIGAGHLPAGGMLHTQGSMSQAINYASIAPDSTAAAVGAKAVSSNFLLGGQKLSSRKTSKVPPSNASTPGADVTSNSQSAAMSRRKNGPQPLRLPPGKLFFGYELKPLKMKDEQGNVIEEKAPRFQGQGQTLRGGKKKDT
ncbi:MAG: hypothetical protein GOMPHAMPRED_005972 [Gomphillus americanus]|uniref:Ubiquitin fusion degradation protein 1 n=1 Tax=Gomphillus americanus TaxID=1940652 RepID=A0A8H3IWU5_9LECA|nr:MAG: hypothetical protein GOMPHAMPRED_005972 [Gomphillus americanus]